MQANLPVPTSRLARLSLAFTVARRVQQERGTNLAVQAFRMVWGSSNGGSSGGTMTAYAENFSRYGTIGTLPGSTVDYAREVGDPQHNAVVSIGLNWIATQLSEPIFQVTRRKRDGTDEPQANHPLVKVMRRPNPEYDGVTLLAAAAKDRKIAGNGYWVKARGSAGAGVPVELWYVPYWELAPEWPPDGSQFITQYRYRPGGRGAGIPISKENVVHFRGDLNPYNGGRTARANAYPVLREIYQDNESAEYESAITANKGIVGGMFTVDEPGGEIPKEARDELADMWVDKFTGSNRGGVLISSGPLKYTKIGDGPAELGIAELRDRPEDRICAMLGVSPMVLGLTSGASHKTYANYEEAKKSAYDDCILPLLAEFARTLDHQLLPDFPNSEALRCGFDTSHIACLSEDETELYNRLNSAVDSGWMRIDQARVKAGIADEKDSEGEERCKVFKIAKGATVVADLTGHAEQQHEAGELGNEGAAAATDALQNPPDEDEEPSGGGES